MGIIIFPLYLGAIGIIIKSALMILEQHKNNTLETVNILFGIISMLIIYGLIVLSYSKEKKSWALSPLFRFPIFMIYIPFVSIYLLNILGDSNYNQISNSLLICIITSGIFMIIFNNYVFNILTKLGKKKHY